MKSRRGEAKGEREEKKKNPDLDYFTENPWYFVNEISLRFSIISLFTLWCFERKVILMSSIVVNKTLQEARGKTFIHWVVWQIVDRLCMSRSVVNKPSGSIHSILLGFSL